MKVKAYSRTERICMGEQYLDARTGAGAGGAREQGTNAGAGELDFHAREQGTNAGRRQHASVGAGSRPSRRRAAGRRRRAVGASGGVRRG